MSDLEKRVAALEAVIKYGPIAADFELWKQREAVKDAEKKAKEWPQVGDAYWYISYDGDVEVAGWENNDVGCKEIGNCYRTKEEAEAEVSRRKTMTKLRAIAARENALSDIEGVYVIQCVLGKLKVACYGSEFLMNQVYFHTHGGAQKAISELGDELKGLFG